MKYRQWKKNYKKQYGHNPSITVDKRKQRKYVKRIVNGINDIDWVKIGLQIRDAISDAMVTIGEAFTNVGNILKNYATDYIKENGVEERNVKYDMGVCRDNNDFLDFLYNHIPPNEMEQYLSMYHTKDKVAVNGYADKSGLMSIERRCN